MSEWIAINPGDPDHEVLSESALAMAQATIQNAMSRSGISKSELARRMERPRSFISRMLSGSHNLTVKTMARAMAACGHEVEFGMTPIRWHWAEPDETHAKAITTMSKTVPALEGTLVPATRGSQALGCLSYS